MTRKAPLPALPEMRHLSLSLFFAIGHLFQFLHRQRTGATTPTKMMTKETRTNRAVLELN